MNPVVRVGDTVRRQLGPWSPGVHALLRHLRTAGFRAAPELLGEDDRGREVLGFIQGEIAHHADPKFLWSDGTLELAGRTLREFHDAQRGFRPPWGVAWSPIGREPDGVPELICHNDFAPYNCVCRSGDLVAMIDFDLCAPGSRAWDLAWTAITWVPLFDPADVRGAEIGFDIPRRLRQLADAYGFPDRAALVEKVRRRIDHFLAVSEEQRLARDPWALRTESHLPGWRRTRDHIQANAGSWT